MTKLILLSCPSSHLLRYFRGSRVSHVCVCVRARILFLIPNVASLRSESGAGGSWKTEGGISA